MQILRLHNHRVARTHVEPASVPLQSLHRIVPGSRGEMLSELLRTEVLMQPQRHETVFVKEIVVDDHRRFDPVGLFLDVMGVMRQPVFVDEELRVPEHAVAESPKGRSQD